MMEYSHLHLHTDASLADGLGSLSRTLSVAKSLGFEEIAVTDHGTLANTIRLIVEAEYVGIKPIVGLEGYINIDGKRGHLTLLADGDVGLHSLITLNNASHSNPFSKPSFTVDQLCDNAKGLVCLTGCMASPFQSMSPQDALKLGSRLKVAFEGRLFAEHMINSDSLATFIRSQFLAENLGIRGVLTNDVHFANREDVDVHKVLVYHRMGMSYDNNLLYLQTLDEALARASFLGLDKTIILEYATRSKSISRIIKTPTIKSPPAVPAGPFSPQKLIGIAKQNLKLIVPDELQEKYTNRLSMEFDIIKDMGFAPYFSVLLDLINYAKSVDVKVGPGRGSGAGSLLLYLLGITNVDPIQHGLEFERFLNTSRVGFPDVDVDLESNGREKVLEYAEKTYGAVPIATYSTYNHRSLVRELGRFFKITGDIIDDAADNGVDSQEFNAFASKDGMIPIAYDAMLGQIRHRGKHAGGVIITDKLVPKERLNNNDPTSLVTSWTEGADSELSYAGIVKYDLLGLSVLSVLSNLEKMTGKKPESPVDGHEVFDIFCEGNLSGVFQFSGSPGIRSLTMQIQPRKFSDLVAINALFRPGPIDAGVTKDFHLYMKSPRAVPSFMSDLVEETYGVIIYQEQLMHVFQRAVGGTLSDADLARRTLVKVKVNDPTWDEQVADLKKAFVRGVVNNHGMTPTDGDALWHEMETFARYGFNKSHAVSYTMIAWECAWWKRYHRDLFYAEMLNNDLEKAQTYIIEAASDGLDIVPPNVQTSKANHYVAKDGKIFLPIASVKGVGQKAATHIVDTRAAFGGEFPNRKEFVDKLGTRPVHKGIRSKLLAMGSFDGVPGSDDDVQCDILTFDSMPHAQKELLGYIIPTKRLLDRIEMEKQNGNIVGIIDKIKIKVSPYGEYKVFYMQPSGVFWSRDLDYLTEGEMIAVKIGDRGKALKIVEMNIE